MLPVNDILDAVFLGCFLFGLLLSIVTLVLGVVDLGIGHVGHGGGHAGGHGGDTGHNGDDVGFFNLPTLLAFIAWFGGIGYLARHGLGWFSLLSVIVGIGGGLVGGFLIYLLLAKLAQSDGELDPDDYRLPGTIARVASSIRPGGTGEIIYQQGGVRQVAAARAVDGGAIPRNTEVVVLRVEHGFALVEPWDQLMNSEIEPAGDQPAGGPPGRRRMPTP